MAASNEECDPIDTMFPIASPCLVSWDSMSGDDQARTCQNCRKKVFNISNLTNREARLLTESNTGDLCVRIEVARDGTVVTKKPVENRHRQASIVSKLLAIGSALMFGAFTTGCRDKAVVTPIVPQTAGESEQTGDRSTHTLMGTVTPRIIIPEEEEEKVPSTAERP